jgi:hypothetical protein
LRLGIAGTDPERDALDAVLVPIKARHHLAENFGQPIEAVRTIWAILVKRSATLVKADYVV